MDRKLKINEVMDYKFFFTKKELKVLNGAVKCNPKGFLRFVSTFFSQDEVHIIDMIATSREILMRHQYQNSPALVADLAKAIERESVKYKTTQIAA